MHISHIEVFSPKYRMQEFAVVGVPEVDRVVRQTFDLALQLLHTKVVAVQEAPNGLEPADFQTGQLKNEARLCNPKFSRQTGYPRLGFFQRSFHEVHTANSGTLWLGLLKQLSRLIQT